MGSSSSTEAPQQSPPIEHTSPSGVRMTISSKIVDDAKASKRAQTGESGQTNNQGPKSNNSSSNQSNGSRAQHSSQTASKSSDKASNNQGSSASQTMSSEYEISEEILALEEKINKVSVPSPSLPLMSNQIIDDIKDALASVDSQQALLELPLLERTELAMTKYDALADTRSLTALFPAATEPVCSDAHLAAINCLKGGNQTQCIALLDAYVACSTKFHFADQAKRNQEANRQLGPL